MTAGERTAFERSSRNKKGDPIDEKVKRIRERLIVAMCVNGDDKPLFQPEDVSALSEQNAAVVERIVNVAMRLAGITGADVEELAKNSDTTTVAASP